MTFVSQNDALCIFYNEKITAESAKKLAEKLDSQHELDICYAEDPRKPMLQTKVKINGNPAFYHCYTNNHPEPETSVNKTRLKNHSQAIDYINQVYLPDIQPDQKLFMSKLMSMNEVYSEMILITDLFDDKSVKSFSTWCGLAKLNFTSIEQTRNYKDNTRHRLLWVLKEEYRESIANKILNVGQVHEVQIKELKNNKYQVIGYARKSPGTEDDSSRLRLLELMVDRLIEYSSVDMVFASYSSKSKQPFADRDKTDPVQVPKTSGNTQDLLNFLSTARKPVVIVAIDFAGLTTNKNDLLQWLRDYEIIKIVLIDNIVTFNRIYTFTREQILTDMSVLKQFDSRPAPVKRSLKS